MSQKDVSIKSEKLQGDKMTLFTIYSLISIPHTYQRLLCTIYFVQDRIGQGANVLPNAQHKAWC